MIEYEYLKFLNLQYWYCIIYSLFGGKCAAVDSPTQYDLQFNGAGAIPTPTPAPAATSQVSFWEWLFGGGSGDYSGPFSFVVNGFGAIFAVVSAIFGIVWGIYSILAYTASGLLLLIITGAAIGLFLIRQEEISLYSTIPSQTTQPQRQRSRWQVLLDGVMAEQPLHWRESILGADELLGALLQKLGYPGATTQDKLRVVPDDAFVTLPLAWEAHRIRNFVAGNSADYILTQREAFRVMKLYEQVFAEFDFI